MMWLFLLCLVVAVLASAEDIWRRRVSNAVTAGAFVAGVALRSWLFGLDGLWDALLGAVIGFVVFLVFYWLGDMGGEISNSCRRSERSWEANKFSWRLS